MRMKNYRYTHNKDMGTTAVAQMTATMLYHKRFFPYYVSNILAGLDSEVGFINRKRFCYFYLCSAFTWVMMRCNMCINNAEMVC